jgi:hypothetical protein
LRSLASCLRYCFSGIDVDFFISATASGLIESVCNDAAARTVAGSSGRGFKSCQPDSVSPTGFDAGQERFRKVWDRLSSVRNGSVRQRAYANQPSAWAFSRSALIARTWRGSRGPAWPASRPTWPAPRAATRTATRRSACRSVRCSTRRGTCAICVTSGMSSASTGTICSVRSVCALQTTHCRPKVIFRIGLSGNNLWKQSKQIF